MAPGPASNVASIAIPRSTPPTSTGAGAGAGAGSQPTTPTATQTANPLEPSPAHQHRQRVHKRSATGFIPTEGEPQLKEIFPGDPGAWKTAIKDSEAHTDEKDIEASIVRHIHSTLARAAFNVDTLAMYQATAHSVRDLLLKQWNETQIYHTTKKPKRVYYFSLEFLQGKALDNALLNLAVKPEYAKSVQKLGFPLEDLFDCERDAGLGNGGLGRLASCYLDSLSTCEIPAWGYGLRYKYGIFQQLLGPQGQQIEAPDPWLSGANPWEVARLDVAIEVRLYGEAIRTTNEGKGRGRWQGGQIVLAVPHDMPIPGYGTNNMNNIRFWAAKPRRAFDLASFNVGDYDRAVHESAEAETISAVLYPNDNHDAGKTLRLTQQYFWCAASLSDIVRRFKKMNVPWTEFPQYNAIQLNDTHPSIAIVELMRILVDEEEVPWDDAWKIVRGTFGYTNHTVLPEALEKWSVPLMQHLLPRHMQLIFDLNLYFLREVEAKYPGDVGKLSRMSLVEEGYPQHVRMANLAVIGSHRVNGVAEIHSGLVKELFPDFVEYLGKDHFGNVTNGITPRRWLLQCNPKLATLITDTLGNDKWLKDMYLLKGLEKYAKDKTFQKKFKDIKLANKEKLAAYIKETRGITVKKEALFDIQVKRIHEYKRQTMHILGCIHRYVKLKALSPEERKKVVPRVSIFAGKAAPGYYIAKKVIQLVNAVGAVVNNDKDIGDTYKVLFLPDYSVSLAEILVPASDISQHISTAGTEASGTSCMKFALNGGLLLGTVDGATIEIAEEVGDDQVFFFGNLAPDVPQLRHDHVYRGFAIPPELGLALKELQKGTFGDPNEWQSLINLFYEGKDYYLIADDFQSYLEAQRMVDEAFVKPDWVEKTILTTARMGKFSSDRCIQQYCEEIWNAEPVSVPSIK